MSDSAPVVIVPNTISSATRPPSATLILAAQPGLLVVGAVVVGRGERDAERLAARDDRDLADRVGARREHADERVAGLVVGDAAAVLVGEDRAARGAEDDLLQRVGEVGHLDLLVAAAGRPWSAASLARLARSAPTMPGVVAASRSRLTSSASGSERVWTARIFARPSRSGGGTATRRSKRPGPQQRGVEDLRPVRGAEDDHRDVGLEAVHLGEDLVERLLALVVAAAEARAGAARAPDRVELVDEDDRRARPPWPA